MVTANKTEICENDWVIFYWNKIRHASSYDVYYKGFAHYCKNLTFTSDLKIPHCSSFVKRLENALFV